MTHRKPTPSYTAEFRARGVRLFKENRAEYASDNAAYLAIAPKLGCSPDSLRSWCRQADRDADERRGLSSDEKAAFLFCYFVALILMLTAKLKFPILANVTFVEHYRYHEASTISPRLASTSDTARQSWSKANGSKESVLKQPENRTGNSNLQKTKSL